MPDTANAYNQEVRLCLRKDILIEQQKELINQLQDIVQVLTTRLRSLEAADPLDKRSLDVKRPVALIYLCPRHAV